MSDISPFQDLSKAFKHSSKVTFSNSRKCVVNVSFPLPFQYLNGTLSNNIYIYIYIYIYTCIYIYQSLKYLISCSVNIPYKEHHLVYCLIKDLTVKILLICIIRSTLRISYHYTWRLRPRTARVTGHPTRPPSDHCWWSVFCLTTAVRCEQGINITITCLTSAEW